MLILNDDLLRTDDLLELIPHRYPFLFIDKIIKLIPNKGLLALKHVTTNEQFFKGHFPNRQLMPGVLVIESMLQASAIYVMQNYHQYKDNSILYLIALDHVRFRKSVLPGDTMYLQIKQLRFRPTIYKMSGLVKIKGVIVIEAVFTILLRNYTK